MSDADSPSEEAIAGMVDHLRPSWQVAGIETVGEGVNTTAILTLETRTAVLKAATASYPAVTERSRAEPRLLSLVARETSIPVPTVLGVCDDHPTFPSPFSLLEYLDGQTVEDRPDKLAPHVRETVFREAGRNLADLHRLGPLPCVGTIGYRDGSLRILDTAERPRFDSFHEWLRNTCERRLDCLEEDGGLFPELTDDPERFDDLVPELRQYFRDTLPALPDPAPPTYCHKDYRYGNLLVDPETGDTLGLLDWDHCMSAPPAFNLALAESKLLSPDLDDEPMGATGRADELRRAMWDAYTDSRAAWKFDEATQERIEVYRLAYRLAAMACLPMWHPSMDTRDARASEHRLFIGRHI